MIQATFRKAAPNSVPCFQIEDSSLCRDEMGFEHAVKIAGATAHGLRKFFQRRLLLAPLDDPTGFGDERCVFAFKRKALGIAPFARPEAGRARTLQSIMERHVLRVRGAGRTGRSTINPRCRDRVPDMAIGRLVTGQDARSTRIVRDGGRGIARLVRHLVHDRHCRILVSLLPDPGPDLRLLHSDPCF
jgi:hypothetical protein